jgi:SAM-dependent methyltransferase
MADETHRSGLEPDDYFTLTGFDGDWRDTWWDEDYLRFMAGQLDLAKVERVVDLGCGVGHWGQRLMRFMPDATLVGVDAEPEWMDRARSRGVAVGLEGRVTYQVGHAEKLPMPDASVDMVTCQTVLMHVRDPAVVIQEARRVLRPGGLFLAAEPNNFGNAASQFACDPPLEWPIIRDMLELDYRCARGKEALGEGWGSVAERLPNTLAQLGFTGIKARLNSQCHPRIPPDYTGSEQVIDFLRLNHEQGAVMGAGGTAENGRRQFIAGGGTAESFETLWAVAYAHQGHQLAAIEAGLDAGAGGFLHYLIWGRRPA